MRFIEAHNMTKVYGTGDNAFYALNDVSFSIDKGCFVAVNGVDSRNACYKVIEKARAAGYDIDSCIEEEFY